MIKVTCEYKPTFRILCTKHTIWTLSDTAHCRTVDSTSLFLPTSRSHELWIHYHKKSVAAVWGGRFIELWKFVTTANLAASSYFRLKFNIRTEYETKIIAGVTKEVNLPTLFRQSTLFLGTSFTISWTALHLCRDWPINALSCMLVFLHYGSSMFLYWHDGSCMLL
jgi:hypothetical protein